MDDYADGDSQNDDDVDGNDNLCSYFLTFNVK